MAKAATKSRAVKNSPKALNVSRLADRHKTTKTFEPPRANSKAANLIMLLSNKQGVSLEQLQKAGGWQPHSVRGFLSGTVKKRLGLPLRSFQTKEGERRYTTAGS